MKKKTFRKIRKIFEEEESLRKKVTLFYLLCI